MCKKGDLEICGDMGMVHLDDRLAERIIECIITVYEYTLYGHNLSYFEHEFHESPNRSNKLSKEFYSWYSLIRAIRVPFLTAIYTRVSISPYPQ